MQLFQLRSHQVIYEPQVMSLQVFADIRDKNKGDDALTIKELSYIWFFTDVRSFYQDILDEQERKTRIIEEIAMPEGWLPGPEVEKAIEFYRKRSKTPSSGLYNASRIAAQFIERKLMHPETLLSEVDARGNPLYKLDHILKMIKDMPATMIKLHEAQEQVVKEIESKSQARGDKIKAVFEDDV